MDVGDLELIRSVLHDRRSAIEEELVPLDAAISRLDKVIDAAGLTAEVDAHHARLVDEYHAKFQALRSVKDSAS